MAAVLLEEMGSFGDQAGGDLLVDAGFDSLIEFGSRPIDSEEEGVVGRGGFLVDFGSVGLAGDFEGADDVAEVVWVDGGGGMGVEGLEDLVDGEGALRGGEVFIVLAEGGVGAGVGKLVVLGDGADIEAGAADEDGDFLAMMNFGDSLIG